MDGFGSRLAAAEASQWGDPTPCADWDVRALVNHLVYEASWVAPLFEGMTVAEVGDRYDGDLVGDDPKAAWQAAAAAAVGSLDGPDVDTRPVHLSYGDTTGADYLTQIVADHVVHTWDLARGLHGDEALDPELVSFAWDYLSAHAEEWRAGGALGPAVEVPADADLQSRLIALTGRQP